jgi:hypothetical protein
LGAFKAITRKSRDGTSIDDLARMESVWFIRYKSVEHCK